MKPPIFAWPIEGKVTQGFGRPALAVEPAMWLAPDESRCKPTKFPGAAFHKDVHPGIDIAAKVGTPILAPDDGWVVSVVRYRIYNPFVGFVVMGTYAMFRFRKHGGRQAILHVDHLSRVKAEGSHVKKGKPWAWTGSSGVVTGPHAHLEVRVGPSEDAPQQSWSWFRRNPERYLRGELA